MAQHANDIITSPRSFYKLNGVSCYSLLKLQFDLWCLLSSGSHFSKNLMTTLSNADCLLSKPVGLLPYRDWFSIKHLGCPLHSLYTRLIVLLDSWCFVVHLVHLRTPSTHFLKLGKVCRESICTLDLYMLKYIFSFC